MDGFLQELAGLADVPVDVEVELGRSVMTIAQILELGPDSVIRTGRSAGCVDILVGGTLIGFGEIAIIGDAVGVRITDLGPERGHHTILAANERK